jgi:hypothetical protein
MSLKAFHVVFVTASALLAFGFAAEPAAGAGRLFGGAAAVAAGIGLGFYEAWFLKKMRGLP